MSTIQRVMYYKIAIVYFCFFFTWIQTYAQISKETPTLLNAPLIALDSNFNSPDKPFYFDRDFRLRFDLPGKVNVTGFIISPVDENGIKDVNRRDYRIFIRGSSSNRSERKKNRKLTTWETFSDTNTLFPDIKRSFVATQKAKLTEITLLIPPLDPRRDYQIQLITTDDKILEIFSQLNDPLKNVLSSATQIDLDAFNALRTKYAEIYKNPISVRKIELHEFLSIINGENNLSLQTRFDSGKLAIYQSDKFEHQVEMRFVFSKKELIKKDVDSLSADRYQQLTSGELFGSISPALVIAESKIMNVKDFQGKPLIFSDSVGKSEYQLFLWAIIKVYDKSKNVKYTDSIFEKLAALSFIGKNKKLIRWLPLKTVKAVNQSLYKDDLSILNQNTMVSDKLRKMTLSGDTYKLLVRLAKDCPCETIAIKNTTEREDLLKLLGFFYYPVDNYLVNAAVGHSALSSPNDIELSDRKINITNLDASLKSVELLGIFFRTAIAETNNVRIKRNLKDQIEFLIELHTRIMGNKDRLVEAQKADSRILKRYIQDSQFASIISATRGSTEVFDFMTASKFKIVPDFGFVVISDRPSKGLINDLVPYLGFNINFRSIDRDIPMNKVRNKPWNYYFSFIAGITLTSIKIEHKREDLFASNSLMVGFGFRLNNWLKVIGGSLLYKKFSVNPLSDEKKLAASAFAGLSIDYELKELFGGIKTLFK